MRLHPLADLRTPAPLKALPRAIHDSGPFFLLSLRCTALDTALYRRVCLVYEDELRRAFHGKGSSPALALASPSVDCPIAPTAAPKCLLTASPLQPSTPPTTTGAPCDAVPIPNTPEEWRLFRASMQSAGADDSASC